MKSLNTLREAIAKLEIEQRELENPRGTSTRHKSAEELKTREDLLVSLSKQYDRLSGLCEGLGIHTEALETRQSTKQPVQEEQLIDRCVSPPYTRYALLNLFFIASRDSSDVPLQDLTPHRTGSTAKQPHTTVHFDADAETESEQARLDEAEMRAANQDVALMQKRMMDGEAYPSSLIPGL